MSEIDFDKMPSVHGYVKENPPNRKKDTFIKRFETWLPVSPQDAEGPQHCIWACKSFADAILYYEIMAVFLPVY